MQFTPKVMQWRQPLSWIAGQLEFPDLREPVEEQPGDDFDTRDNHRVVPRGGNLRLWILK